MKKILLSLICFLTLGSVSAVAEPENVEFTYPTTVKKGEEFEVRLVISGVENLKYVKATNYRIDSDKITNIDFDTLNGFVGLGVGNSPYTSIDGNPGFLMKNETGKNGNVEVLYLKFKVKDTVKAGDKINIRMDQVFIGRNEDGTDLANISNDNGYCITINVVQTEVVENPKCEYKNNKYYDNNGNVVTKQVYEQLCGNPETGINSTIVIVIAVTLLTAGCYTFFKKNKMYY